MAGPSIPVQPLSRPGRTYAVALWVLCLLLVAQIVYIGYAVVSRMDWPKPVAANGKAPGEMSEAEILEREAALLDSLSLRPSEVTMAPAPAAFRDPSLPLPAPSTSPGYIADDAAMEMVQLGRALRADGDMSGALEKFREADARLPGNPRILYEMASAYTAMGLASKASNYWQQIWQLGSVAAGDYYAIADLNLKGGSNAGLARRPETKLFVNQAFIKRHPEITDGEQVTVRVSIKAADGAEIDTSKLFIDFPFFDLVDGRSVAPSMADTPVQSWVTPPVDWKDQNEEILDMIYFFPKMDAEDIRTDGAREYYGFVVKLYYDDVLQDIYSHPRTLLDQIRRERETGAPFIDDSLFPRD